ncbi:NAD-dependent epimerase/dehydratase family protein [Vulgatibacter incomptus]|uniref:UDP-glucose 4-epimerase n=1 Tax=Vulgatibacter incomptus TaxID=1391653 RepID=A0A0K1P8T9_9BACT|nr:NAD-dependent epimerase/dehydratase family protein [Vulgatibacter incomptus]AKU89922.1 UDP-glucose 4-epimerase [Vulgatibacter incomptus]
MRVLLTGGSGFVGPAAAKALSRAGHEVRCLMRETSDRSGIEATGIPVEYALGDVCDAASLPAAVEGVDAVVHVAGLTKGLNSQDYYRVNAYGTRLLAEAAVGAGVKRFVHCSTLAVAGPMPEGRPSVEGDTPVPVSNYGRSKLAGEELLRRHADKLEITIVRPPIVYGPRDKDFFEVFKMASLGIALKPGLFGSKRYSIIHVEDLGSALAIALDKGHRVHDSRGGDGIYYVSDGGIYTWEELIRRTATALGRDKAVVIPVPEVLSWPVGLWSEVAARITGKPQIISFDKIRETAGPGWSCSIDRARDELGFEPDYPLDRGLAETASWYRENRWI